MVKITLKYLTVLIMSASLYAFIVYKDMSHNVLNNYSNYHAAIIDKISILKNSSSSKILLLGGSNLAFGVNSDKLHLSSNMQVVNMGLHIGTGLNVTFKIIDKYINNGDIILCSPEYDYFYGDRFYGDSHLIDTMYYVPEYLHTLFDANQIYAMIDKNIYRNTNVRQRMFDLYVARKHNATVINDIYYREGFNKYGDVVSHLDKANRSLKIPQKAGRHDEYFVGKLVEFKKHVEKKGAKFIFAYPCISKTQYDADIINIHAIHKLLVKNNISLDVSPNDFVFEDNCFFDTRYHLNTACRERRTVILEKLVKKLM